MINYKTRITIGNVFCYSKAGIEINKYIQLNILHEYKLKNPDTISKKNTTVGTLSERDQSEIPVVPSKEITIRSPKGEGSPGSTAAIYCNLVVENRS